MSEPKCKGFLAVNQDITRGGVVGRKGFRQRISMFKAASERNIENWETQKKTVQLVYREQKEEQQEKRRVRPDQPECPC